MFLFGGAFFVLGLFIVLYTIFVPVLTLDGKHFKRGLLLLAVLVGTALVLHFFKLA